MAKDRHTVAGDGEQGLVAPAGLHLVPTELVLLLAVALPEMPLSQRKAAAVFAIEDQIGQPLDDVHVVLGPQMGDVWLVAVIARHVLDTLPASRCVADVGMLPPPANGAWSIWAEPDRLLIRLSDGTGFSANAKTFGIYHLAAGHPALIVYGGNLPDGFVAARHEALPAMDARFARFNLNAGRTGTTGLSLPRGSRAMAWLVAVACLGHLGLLGLDTYALQHLHDVHAAEVRSIAGLAPDAPLDATVVQVLAARPQMAPSPFLPVFSKVSVALNTTQLSLRDLRYLSSTASLTMTVEAVDIPTLQAAQTAMSAAGLQVAAGAASRGNGIAEQQFTLTMDPP